MGKDSSNQNKPKAGYAKTVMKDGIMTSNDISLNVQDIKVKKATLLYADGGQVPEGNTVDLHTKIKLNLFIEDGWRTKNGRVFLGASETMTNSDGKTIVEAEDLFKDYDNTGIDPADARLIKLSAIMDQEDANPSEYYKVNFRLWDKNGSAEIVGHYKFYIRH
jgi:hypothetical protein